MELVKHETCREYFERRLSEGWKCISLEWPHAILLSPGGIRREIDLRNDVETLRPDAAGDECKISSESGEVCPNHYQNVITADGFTTCVNTDTADYERDLYNVADHSVGTGTINHIRVYGELRVNSILQASHKIPIKSGTGNGAPDTVSESDPITLNMFGGWETHSNQWVTNPATGSAWTWDEIDKLQIGIAIRRGDPESASMSYCTQVYVEIDYTLPTAPTITTQAATVIVPGGATLNGNITDDGGASITEHGFCWKAGADPVNIAGADGYSELGAGTEGAFDQAKTGLTENTLYYYRAYATNSEGTSYGAAMSFTTGETLSGVVSISATPSMSITPLRKRPGVASISAVPSVSVNGGLVASGVVSINAVPSMTIDGDLIASAVAEIEAVSSMSADPLRIRQGAVAIAIVASLFAKPKFTYEGEVNINVVPSLTATGNLIASGETSISVVASLAALATRVIPGECSIQAVASLVALASRIRFAEASISTSAALTAAANLIASGKVDINAVASMTVIPLRKRPGEASIQVTPSMTADPLRVRPGEVSIEAVPSLAIDGDLIASAVASIEAVASLSADPLRIRQGTVSIDAVASLAADGDLIASAIVAIAIISSLTATGNLIAFGQVSIEAIASLIATGITVKLGEVTITAHTSLAATALAYITQSLGYTGTLTAGDVLEIDVDKMTVKLNGDNARANFTGIFPQLEVGDNKIIWKDGDVSRDVDLEVKHKPRYL